MDTAPGLAGSLEPEDGESTLFGSYLAGRVARSERDNVAAAHFYSEALEKDPGNKLILEEAFQLAVATGNREDSKRFAAKLIAAQPDHSLARLFLGIDAFSRGRYREAETHFKRVGKAPLAELAATISSAWVLVADGKADKAITRLGGSSGDEATQFFKQMHTALIADLARKPQLASTAFALAYRKNMRNPRVAEAYARHAANANDNALAEKLLSPFVMKTAPHPVAKEVLDEIGRGEKPKLLITTAQDGLAEIFYGIGEALTGENGGSELALSYLRLALFAKPDFDLAQFTLGDLYDAFKSYETAITAFGSIQESSPLWYTAQIRKALYLQQLDRSEEALALLKSLLDKDPKNLQVLQALGSILREQKKYAEAVTYYTRAIDAVPQPDKRHWTLYYYRGTAYERSKQWPKAEADFKEALKLDGDQASVLNYLGYSWVDQNVNVDEAMSLIKRAVALKPNDGYIVDSLGWAYYRQRQYNKAVQHLERAVELQPQDPILNDHLGDAYWRVGRRREAVYQWGLALSLGPEPEDMVSIKRKLGFAKTSNSISVTAILNQDWVSNMTRAERVFAKALAKQYSK